MQRLVRVPEVAQTMRDMSKEMMRAGIIEEMLDETFESMEDTEEMEDAAQEEIDKVLWELTAGKLGEAPAPPLTEAGGATPVPAQSVDVEEDEEDLEEMQTRLQALKS